MFVYKIINTVNDRVYVGLTVASLRKRWREHKCAANTNVDKPLYRAMRKHGVDKFSIHLIYIATSLDDLREAELRYIAELNAHVADGGYNLTDHGYAHGKANQPVGEELYNAKLTEEMVAFIRDPAHWYKTNSTVLNMVREHFGFDGSHDTVRDVRRGDVWKHLNVKYPPVKVGQGARRQPISKERKAEAVATLKENHAAAIKKSAEMRAGKRGPNARLSEQTVKDIFFSLQSLKKTALEYGVSKKMVLLIKQRKAHVYLTKGL